MAKAGCHVTVLEKHDIPGGRARQLKAAGFTFDMAQAGTGCLKCLNAFSTPLIEEFLTIIHCTV